MKFIGFQPLFLAIAVLGINTLPSPAQSVQSPRPVPLELSQAPPSFNEAQILDLMTKINQAEAAEDVETLVSLLAPFVVSEVTVESGDQTTTRIIEGISAHREILTNSYARSRSKEVLDEKMSVRFDADGNIATVTRYSIETADLTDNRRMVSMGKDTIRFALVEGQPKIISVVTDGWSEERP
jgi:hypothetical protein